ncbi:MAG: hypothetical protein R3E66_12420 [bacterium]
MKKLSLEHTFVCDMDWDTMPGNDTHRHCENCNRTIVNFSKMTEKQAYKLVSKMLEEDEMCGLFEVDGDRILFEPEPISRATKLAAAAAVVLPLMGGCDDQAKAVAPEQTVAHPVAVTPTPEPAGAVLKIDSAPADNDEFACDPEAHEMELTKRDLAALEAKSAMFELLHPRDSAEDLEAVIPKGEATSVEVLQYQRNNRGRRPGKMAASHMIDITRDRDRQK